MASDLLDPTHTTAILTNGDRSIGLGAGKGLTAHGLARPAR